MAKKIKIQHENKTFEAFFEPMATSKKDSIKVTSKSNGKNVKQVTKVAATGEYLKPGATIKVWIDEEGNEVPKETIKYYVGDEEVDKVTQTKVFIGEQLDSERAYTDEFIIHKHYELYPSDGGYEKDIDREIAVSSNAKVMYELWKDLYENKKVLRGEFNPSTGGFVTNYGYIRAVKFENKWGLEIGVFKERKVFKHLQEGIPTEVKAPAPKKKISMI